jgi:hypothetical protein
MEAQKTLNGQSNYEQKEQFWRYHNAWLPIILQSHSNKTSMVLAQNRHVDQGNRIDDPEISLQSYSHLIIIKGNFGGAFNFQTIAIGHMETQK